jgi:phosphatidate cytidylyltransferase
MARPSARPEGNSLGLRLLSAIVLLPICVAAVWAGSWWFAVLLAGIGGAMCWEWARICSPGNKEVSFVMLAAGVAAPLFLIPSGFPAVVAVVAAGVVLILALATLRHLPNRLVLAAGLPYVVLGLASAGWLRNHEGGGVAAVLWVVASVVATDVGAFFVGRTLKGPKLAPRISPNKTWSGLLGGMTCASIAGALTGLATEAAPLPLAVASLALAAIAQGGDLIESKLKRSFHVKDASRLIPGHGGFLDRFDGYLTALPAAALMSALAGGSPLTWQ